MRCARSDQDEAGIVRDEILEGLIAHVIGALEHETVDSTLAYQASEVCRCHRRSDPIGRRGACIRPRRWRLAPPLKGRRTAGY